MFNTCINCGNWHDKRVVDPTGPYAICPSCEYAQPFIKFPLFVLTGPSGAGKSAVTVALMHDLPDFVLLEGDIFWREEFNRPSDNYVDFRNICLRVAKNINQAGKPTVISGTAHPGQYETCPEFCYFDQVYYLALICDEQVLSARLRKRPAWRQSDSEAFIASMLNYNQWYKDNAALIEPAVTLIDTTEMTVRETATEVKNWLYKKQDMLR
ncbi:MAG: AAA family ATPase [Pseudomonadota bacterium]